MNTKIKWGVLVAMWIVLIFAVITLDSAYAQGKKETVKIGLVTWTEGPAVRAGRGMVQGFKLALAEINGKGGILGGRKVEGFITSQGMTGETAKSGALKLVLDNKVKGLIGPHWAFATPAGYSVASKYNLPYANIAGGMWIYEEKQKYPGYLNTTGNAGGRGIPQMRWAEKKGLKKCVLLFSDIAYNHDLEEMIRARWDKPGSPVKVLDIIWYTFGQTELKKELTKALGYGPDYIWSEEWSTTVAVAIMKTLNELGYKGATVLAADLDKEVIEMVPKEVSEGYYSNMEYAYDPNIPENKAFAVRWQKEWGENTMPYRNEEELYEMAILMLTAMDKAGSAGDGTKEYLNKFHKALRSIKWKSPRGEFVRFSPEGIALWKKLPMCQVQNGELKVIEYMDVSPKDWLPWLPENY